MIMTLGLNWQIMNFRATVFHSEIQSNNFTPTFEGLFGVPPLDSTLKKLENTYTETGNVGGTTFSLISKNKRSDLSIYASIDNIEEYGVPVIGKYTEKINDLNGIIENWLNLQNNVVRLAQAVSFFHRVKDKNDGYELLNKLLHNVKVPDANIASDLSFKINRPRLSKVVEDLKINRLTSWQCMQGHFGIDRDGENEISEPFDFILLETDLNTDAEWKKEITPENKIKLYKELDFLSKEISEEGDIS